MLPKRHKPKIVRRVHDTASGDVDVTPKGERSLFGYLDTLRQLLASTAGVDYNNLSFEQKQAALALVDAGEARFVSSPDGRTMLERHAPSAIKRFFTMGAVA